MLIVIADSLASRLPSDLLVRDTLSSLAAAHRFGHHIVSANLGALRTIIEHTTGDTRTTFARIKDKHYEIGALARLVNRYVVVDGECTSLVDVRESNGVVQFVMSPEYFRGKGVLGQSRIVSEDQDDAVLYARCVSGYVFNERIAGVRPVLEVFGGGGSSTADQLEAHARHAPTLCVVDSDKVSTGSSLGDTARLALERKAALIAEVVCEVLVLGRRELENLMPYRLICDTVTREDPQVLVQRIDDANALGILDTMDASRWFDLKNAIRGHDFVVAFAGDVPPHRLVMALESVGDCTTQALACHSADSCACELAAGIGAGFVSRAASHLRHASPQKIAEYLFSASCSSRAEWLHIGALVFSFGCAYPRSRI